MRRVFALAVALTAVSLGGCKIVPLSEWRRMQEYKSLALSMEKLSGDTAADASRLSDKVKAQKKEYARVEADLKEKKEELRKAKDAADRNAEMARSTQQVAETLSKELDALRKQLAGDRGSFGSEEISKIETSEGVGLRLAGSLLFRSGKATLTDRGKKALAEIAKTLIKEKNVRIRVSGFTDSVPIKASGWKSNFQLSGARALAVLDCLTKLGVPAGRMHFSGYGEHALLPQGSAAGKESKAKSRRAEILLLYPKAK